MASSKNVLIVDDNDDIREILMMILKEEGYTPLGASNGLEALEILRKPGSNIALVILDLLMPVLDGWKFREEQKRDPSISSIPVVAMSANSSSAESPIDADRFLAKPVQLDVLIDTIAEFVPQ